MTRPILLAVFATAFAGSAARADLIYGTRPTDSVVGTSGDDFPTGPHALGMTFTYFGTSYTDTFMNSNGNLTFGSGFSTFTNGSFPSGTPPLIAPFWDDLFLPPGDMRINTSVAGEFVALWNGVGYFSAGGTISLEAILLGSGNSFGLVDGSILFSYGFNTQTNSSATVGLNAGNGTDFATLSGLLGSSAGGTLTGSEALLLQGNSYLFTPVNDTTYTVTQFNGTVNAVPAPPALVLAGIGFAGLMLRRRKSA